jgi:hypothetical protein
LPRWLSAGGYLESQRLAYRPVFCAYGVLGRKRRLEVGIVNSIEIVSIPSE